MSEYVLQTTDLTKTYARKNVVDKINLKIRKGDIYGFIGKNGAGKTTTIRLIVGTAKPSGGGIQLFESDNLAQGRKRAGTVIEYPSLYPHMTARQNMEAQRILLGVKDKSVTDELLEVVGLSDTGRKKSKNFSLGMKQRLAIALALVGDPEFLFLDEPINGLDPMGIKEVRDLILKLNKEIGITIMVSSHILGELVKMATCYGIINNGELVDQFTLEELNERVNPFIKISVNDPEKACEIIKAELGIENVETDSESNIIIRDNLSEAGNINTALAKNDIIVQYMSREGEDYESYFIKLREAGSRNG